MEGEKNLNILEKKATPLRGIAFHNDTFSLYQKSTPLVKVFTIFMLGSTNNF